jgi:hypothetical protein
VNYEPGSTPSDDKGIREFLARELRRLANVLKDEAPVVWYRNGAVTASLSAGISANWKVPQGNVIRISASNTMTLTGIAEKTPFRERTFVNVGTGVVVFKSEASESSASNRFALPVDWQISANGSATLWRDPISARHRGLSRT